MRKFVNTMELLFSVLFLLGMSVQAQSKISFTTALTSGEKIFMYVVGNGEITAEGIKEDIVKGDDNWTLRNIL